MRRAPFFDESELYGPNPYLERGMFPRHWGVPPCGLPALRGWIAEHARADGLANGNAATAQVVLAERREDPAAVRERAAVRTAARLRREYLLMVRGRCP